MKACILYVDVYMHMYIHIFNVHKCMYSLYIYSIVYICLYILSIYSIYLYILYCTTAGIAIPQYCNMIYVLSVPFKKIF